MNDDMTDSPDDDTDGHRFIPTEERLAVGDTPDTEPAKDGDDNPDDTDGHRFSYNIGVDFDSESADSTDTQLGETVVESGDDDDDDPDDTEGHRYSYNVGVAFD